MEVELVVASSAYQQEELVVQEVESVEPVGTVVEVVLVGTDLLEVVQVVVGTVVEVELVGKD